jgi:DNA helicase-2/ATP-dependent DNA helicase PcrA
LYIDKDTVADEDDAVKLMTIHSAKGLEFDNVFMVGAEEGIFPGLRSINDLSGEAIEEERRLAYVSITRARKKLYITTAFERMLFGQTQIYPTSRFVLEIPSKYLNEISQRRSYQSQSQSQGPRLEHARQEGSSYFQSTLSKPFRDTVSRSASSPFGRPRNESSSRNAASSDQGDYLKSSDIRKGDIVAHSKFGKGIVRSLVPVANDAIIEIDFDDFGLKKMMVRQAKLSKA